MTKKDRELLARTIIASAVIVSTVAPIVQDRLEKRDRRNRKAKLYLIDCALDARDKATFDQIVKDNFK